ncbi:MAG TPA: N(4)-(beta-N-acetylglucosaminyl)-L-asparaginase [Cyclobacteriaceae bacterium]|nr:N(4)-(beta-N-acetylglucosaminyl)-L-asparaginase [Cyclobacteriaceae bacterium]HRJ82980.1 N(4)-(beta-N-acetylglucosaminyl)-L-asparaginase [Cyclobacteriaceae bacterium]
MKPSATTSRREFLKLSALSATVLSVNSVSAFPLTKTNKPIVVSTWRNPDANAAAWKVVAANGRALDAVEQGARVPEANPKDTSVGYGGLPDRDGCVTLDACIMDEKSNCGAVAFVQGYKHPISIARAVMEKTPHVMLVGKGAEQFAASQGFKKENLLTRESEKAWKEWLKKSEYKPYHNPGQHDTIGILALDANGKLCGACTTSGMAFKMHGRVGDSPIIGAGLYVDGEVGAATATGVGEEMIRIAGSNSIVELMRQGLTPQAACEEAIKRLIRKRGEEKAKELSVAFLALSVNGEVGAYSTNDVFEYTLTTPDQMHSVIRSESYF